MPQLAPPGAGLPAAELFAGRLIFAFSRLIGSRESLIRDFQRERSEIREWITPLQEVDASRRVLIPRVRGLEDSSRYWSVWMTLDHLRIVHGSIIRVIGALTSGIVLKGEASTAAVKPSDKVTGAIVTDYEKSCDDLIALVSNATDLKTKVRYAHPWFGPLNAEGWHALSVGHLGIHRRQIQRICQALKSASHSSSSLVNS